MSGALKFDTANSVGSRLDRSGGKWYSRITLTSFCGRTIFKKREEIELPRLR